MTRFAQIRSDMGILPWEGAFCLLLAALVIAIYVLQFGMTGLVVSLIAIGIAAYCMVIYRRRHPRLNLADVGEIQLDMGVCSQGQSSPKILAGFFIGYAILLALLAGRIAIGILYAHLEGSNNDPASLRSLAQAIATAALWALIAYSSYRSLWRRLLVTNQGLFQIVDARLPWPTDRCIGGGDSALWAVKIHTWDQVAQYYWTCQRGKHTLHLHVRRTGIAVPQLVSYTFPVLSHEGQHQFDELLLKYTAISVSSESGRSLTATAAP